MKITITRRRLGALAFVTLAGCTGSSDSAGDDNGDGAEDDPDFESTADQTEQEGSIDVTDQRGQGRTILINSATANVDYRIVIEYADATVQSSTISAEESFSGEVELSTRITEPMTIRVRIVSASDEEQLTAETFEYSIEPPGAKLSSEEVKEIVNDPFPLVGTDQRRPWSFHHSWRDFPLESAVDGWVVSVNWNSEHPSYKWFDELTMAEETERIQALFASYMFEAFYTSDYEISSVSVRAFLNSEYDQGGNPQWKQSQYVRLDRDTAEEINWENFVDLVSDEINESADISRLVDVASEYEFSYLENPDD
jgi:hypothetical protein